MRALKREHLGLDGPTDVLSFPIDGREPVPDGVPRQLGDANPSLARRYSGRRGARRSSMAPPPARLRARGGDGGAAGAAPWHEAETFDLDSFNFAFEGSSTLRTQRNMRIHFIVAVAVLVAAIATGSTVSS